ncbi:MAG: phosphatidylserine decarboxylase family protein [Firmicutes bacterium]|nr:phosphatidylserine decarboxylase family protein [Bacillota bacterium]
MIIKDGIPYIAVLIILCLFFYFLHPVLALIPAGLLLFVVFFFRNPPRQIPENDQHILSPADGKIMEIKEIKDTVFFGGKVTKITIFLSVFNVHVNRAPIKGKITHTEYRPGKFLPAFKGHASDVNERNTIGIENEHLKVMVHQITGFIARRIVFYHKKGDFLSQGSIFGMIKFGSCTEIVIPAHVKTVAQKGQKVKAGISVLGVLRNEQ